MRKVIRQRKLALFIFDGFRARRQNAGSRPFVKHPCGRAPATRQARSRATRTEGLGVHIRWVHLARFRVWPPPPGIPPKILRKITTPCFSWKRLANSRFQSKIEQKSILRLLRFFRIIWDLFFGRNRSKQVETRGDAAVGSRRPGVWSRHTVTLVVSQGLRHGATRHKCRHNPARSRHKLLSVRMNAPVPTGFQRRA